jgi:alpha-beta hydrolase superfamily lysophospholipase
MSRPVPTGRRDAALLHHYEAVPGRERGSVGTATTRDGLTLLARHWPADGTAWARVLVLHGLSEHSGRYERVGGWLARAGLDTWAYDQRGWGASDGQPGHAARWDDYLDDLGERVAALRALEPALPVIVYAHSLGGLITTEYALFETPGRPRPDAVVLSGAGLLSIYPWWLIAMARILGKVVPTWRPPRTGGGETLSRDPEVARHFAADPLLGRPSAGFGYEGLRQQVRAQRGLETLRAEGKPFPVPALVMHGDDDGLVPFKVVDWFRPLGNVEVRPYAGLRHELHNEPEGEEVVADVIAWLRGRFAAGR